MDDVRSVLEFFLLVSLGVLAFNTLWYRKRK